MSLVLRHKPEEIGLVLDDNGWVSVEELVEKLNAKGEQVNRALIHLVVENNDKQRFSFNHDQSMIRANQGHSIEVDLALTAVEPPAFLYHGTAAHLIPIIMKEGLQKKNRHHVHLTENIQMAMSGGTRHGVPVVLKVSSKEMAEKGIVFFRSENNVWLVDEVPPVYLQKISH